MCRTGSRAYRCLNVLTGVVYALLLASAPASFGSEHTDRRDRVQSERASQTIKVDFSKPIGVIRHLHDIHSGPLAWRGAIDLSSYYSDLGIKFIRLHDSPWVYKDMVDIDYIFPRFEADVDNPDNYVFEQSDEYIGKMKAGGFEMIYRLGYSADVSAKHNVPPSDFGKWASVCANIARHYNDGWANGYHYNIRYWEIWNEPDIQNFWKGTREEYFQLYEATARALKTVDPSLKTGGPATASAAKDNAFMDAFLKYCKERQIPLDFCSWHMYRAKPYELCESAIEVRELLDKYGFTRAETVLDEWNYFPGDWELLYREPQHQKYVDEQIGGMAGASFAASALIYLQDSKLDVATYYTGWSTVWGLFDQYGIPRKNFYAFKALSLLMETPRRVFCKGSDLDGLAVISGISADKSRASILVSNFDGKCSRYSIHVEGLPWRGTVVLRKYVLDANHDLELVKTEDLSTTKFTVTEDVETPSVCLIQLTK